VLWVQYQLDTATNTGDVLSGINNERIFINKRSPGLHYFICDPHGTCAVVEFLDGKPVIYTGDQLQVHVLANDTYFDSLRSYQHYVSSAEKSSWVDRFTRAGSGIERWDHNNEINSIDGMMAILGSVAQEGFTINPAFNITN